MAIRDHFRRRKSISEPSQGERDGSEPKSPALRLAKTLGWRSKDEKPKKKAAPVKEEKEDPRERPFNETNLRHQEIFHGFTMTFGKRPLSREERSSYYSINVSPGTSRHNSVDVDDGPLRMNPLAREPQYIRSVPEEEERS
ncbi:hypothetical protein CCHL11_05499 [Colletotrichum chlorophyti]|uniref:Uncharacterized protein n=1 Tax=Colletotrichum chlorophyti TaxID=708187 RepID=A0A1Q8RBC5_9PEZI|nr:hypothetical protein CCHL11_05499 [Colletotrichum chlorophyti]